MKKLKAIAGISGLVIVLSCGGGDEGGGEDNQKGILYADVFDYGNPDSLDGEAMLYSDVMVDISDLTLRINAVELDKDEWEGDPYPNFMFAGAVPKADPSNLSFASSVIGNGSSSVKIPGPTTINSPAYSDTLPTGVDVNVSWNTTPCDFYWFDVDVDFYDQYGSYLEYREWNGYSTSTSYTIPADSLAYPGAAYAEVWFDVSPVYGPVPTPGTQGNITGDIEGFFYGVNEGDGVYFYVGTPVKAYAIKRPKEASRERFLKSMRELTGY